MNLPRLLRSPRLVGSEAVTDSLCAKADFQRAPASSLASRHRLG